MCVCKLLQSCLSDPMDCRPPGSSVHGFSRQQHWSGLPCPPPGDLPDPGIKPRSPASHSLLSEPPGKPQSTRVSSLSLLQGIFPTQEWNWGLLHFKQIFYQLSYYWATISLLKEQQGREGQFPVSHQEQEHRTQLCTSQQSLPATKGCTPQPHKHLAFLQALWAHFLALLMMKL